jgi:hypothetical protein
MSLLSALTPAAIGLHLMSQHMPQNDQNNRNPGVYVITEGGQIAGTYTNSHSRRTLYVGQTFKAGPVDLGLVLASGYDIRCSSEGNCRGFSKHRVTPLAALTYAVPLEVMGARPRLWLAPGMGKASSVFHLSAEWSIK